MVKDEVYTIWLSKFPKVGLVHKKELFKRYPDLESLQIAREKGFQDCEFINSHEGMISLAERFDEHIKRIREYEEYVERISSKKVYLLTLTSPLYPESLRNMEDSPLVIYAQGQVRRPEIGIGIVGSRRCSDYGRKAANHIAKELASYGVNVISGLAYGIDKAAHIGALEGDGYTTAVLAGGIHQCYPKEHQKLFDEIKEKGCILSEEMYGCETKPYMFPKRNRIISGMSRGVVIVEAAQKSGSLITADFALEQGKEVFTVPHRIFDGFAEGSNNLIRQGAKVVFGAEEILQEFVQFDKKKKNIDEKFEKVLDEIEKIVYSCISYEPIHLECIFDALQDVSMEDLHYYLVMLEMKGLIIKKSGCYYARSEV